MTLDEAIIHVTDVANENERMAVECESQSNPPLDYRSNQCKACVEEHRQLAKWLNELKELKLKTCFTYKYYANDSYYIEPGRYYCKYFNVDRFEQDYCSSWEKR